LKVGAIEEEGAVARAHFVWALGEMGPLKAGQGGAVVGAGGGDASLLVS